MDEFAMNSEFELRIEEEGNKIKMKIVKKR